MPYVIFEKATIFEIVICCKLKVALYGLIMQFDHSSIFCFRQESRAESRLVRNSPFMNQIPNQNNQSKEIFEIKDHLVKVERNVGQMLNMAKLLAHLSHWLIVSYCDHWKSVVNNCFK